MIGQGFAAQLPELPWPPSTYIAPMGSLSTAAPPNNTLRLIPLQLPNAIRLIGMDVETTVAGDAGCLLRMGLWAMNGLGFPVGLPVTGGVAVPGDAAAGFQEAVFNVVVPAGNYWAGCVVEGAPTVQPTVRTQATGFTSVPVTAPSLFNIGYQQAGVTPGSLPSLPGTQLAIASSVHRFNYRTGVI